MTRFIHDQFAKDYLETLLTPYGTVQAPRRVAGEVRQIDVWFAPTIPPSSTLGLLSQLTATPCILEPYRNPASTHEICDCLLKQLEVRGELHREARREERSLQNSEIPHLWILTPTASTQLCASFTAVPDSNWQPGIHFLAPALKAAIVAIHQLPVTPETLWLRILGRGTVQKRAIDELTALLVNTPLRQATLELLYGLQKNLEVVPDPDKDDQELIMRLAPLYQQDREQAKQEGIQQGIQQGVQQGVEQGIQQGVQQGIQQGVQQGERLVIENILKTRFGELDESLLSIVEASLALTPDEFTPLLMQLSREELIERFNQR